MTMQAWRVKWTALGLLKFQQEILVMLLDCGLRSRQISEQLDTVELNSRQVGNRMRDLAKQGFVGRVQASPGVYLLPILWCLTADGREVARWISEAPE